MYYPSSNYEIDMKKKEEIWVVVHVLPILVSNPWSKLNNFDLPKIRTQRSTCTTQDPNFEIVFKYKEIWGVLHVHHQFGTISQNGEASLEN